MELKYDPSVDAAYIKLSKGIPIKKTDSFSIEGIIPFGDINIDFNATDEIVGLEILNASKYLSNDILKIQN